MPNLSPMSVRKKYSLYDNKAYILDEDAQYKKKMLANRVAVLIGTTTSEIIQIYTNMLKYYSYRSESLHEGIRTNISKEELYNLEQYVRDVLKEMFVSMQE